MALTNLLLLGRQLKAVQSHLLVQAGLLHHGEGVFVCRGKGETVQLNTVQEQRVLVHSVSGEKKLFLSY